MLKYQLKADSQDEIIIYINIKCPQRILEQIDDISLHFLKVFYLKWPLRIIWIEIKPHESWCLIFDPCRLQPSIMFCYFKNSFYVMTWIQRISKFVNFMNCPRTFGGHCISIFNSIIIVWFDVGGVSQRQRTLVWISFHKS